VDRQTVEAYLCRAAAAESVRELHAIAQAVRAAHPDDADAELIERVCWAAVPRLFAAALTRPRSGTRGASRKRDRRPQVDWKMRAAGM
jgi:hypothetical protein